MSVTSPARRAYRAALVTIAALVALVVAMPSAIANPSIPGGSSGPNGLIWMPNYGAYGVEAVDPVTMQSAKKVPLTGDHPMVVKSNPDHTKLFVGNFGPLTWNVSVIDTATGTKVKDIPTLGAAYAVIQMSRDGRHLYVPTSASFVQVIDTETLQTVRIIPALLPPGMAHLEVSDDESTIYAFSATGQVTPYSTATGLPTRLPLFLGGLAPGWGATSHDGSMMYAVNFWGGINWIDPVSWRVVRTAKVGPWNSNPISATLTPDGSELWVCNYSTNDVRILDANTGVEKRRFATNGAAVYIGFSDGGKTAYLSEVADGMPLPYFNPLVHGWQYYAKDEAYFAPFLGLRTRLVKMDTATLARKQTYETNGAFVAGVYPE